VPEQNIQVHCIRQEEQDKVLMIPVSQTVVDEWTMVIKFFNTSIAEVTVE